MKKWKERGKRIAVLLLTAALIGSSVDLSALTVNAAEDAAALKVNVELGGAQLLEATTITPTKPENGNGTAENPYQITSAAELVKRQRDFTDFVLQREKIIFGQALKQEFARAENANLFLGSGSGFLSKSLLLALAPDQKSFTDAAAVILHNNFYKHAHLRLDKFAAPRGLQTAKTHKGITLMGVCAVTEE